MGRKKESKARKTKVGCKTCYDHDETKHICTLDKLKRHHQTQNEQRSKATKKRRIQHPVLTLAPSQLLPFVHYYPINQQTNELVLQSQSKTPKQARLKFTSKKMSTAHSTSKKISTFNGYDISKEHVIIPPSAKANNMNKKKRKRSEVNFIEEHDEEPSNKRQKIIGSQIAKGFKEALKAANDATKILSLPEINEQLSAIDEMNVEEQLIVQQSAIKSLSTMMSMQNCNALKIS